MIVIAPGAIKTAIWDKAQETDITPFRNSPYFPALQKVLNFTRYLSGIALPPERIGERIAEVLSSPNPKVRYTIAPDPMRHIMISVLPKRQVDRQIARRLGLQPPQS